MNKPGIIDSMEIIMQIALRYCQPNETDIGNYDWHTVYIIAEMIHRRLTDE